MRDCGSLGGWGRGAGRVRGFVKRSLFPRGGVGKLAFLYLRVPCLCLSFFFKLNNNSCFSLGWRFHG